VAYPLFESDPSVADTLVERLGHDVHRMTVHGESMRKVLSNVTGSSATHDHAPSGHVTEMPGGE
jgi:hypothetical protein